MNGFGQFITKIVSRPVVMINKMQISSLVFRSQGLSVDRHTKYADFYYQQSRNAGHSKWANIKHTKEAKDMERSTRTSKYVNMIKIAIREGGGSADPKLNSRLAQVMSQIKDAKLPMAPFEKALEKETSRVNEKQQTLLFRGPGNCVVVTDISSDSIHRTKQELNTILRKNKGVVGEDTLIHLFDYKGIIRSNELNGKPAHPDNLDSVIEDAIESGANDVIFQSDSEFGSVYEFSTSPDVFFRVKHALEKLNYTIIYGDVDYVPLKPIELDEVVIQEAHKLYQKLAEHPQVVKVTTNIA